MGTGVHVAAKVFESHSPISAFCASMDLFQGCFWGVELDIQLVYALQTSALA